MEIESELSTDQIGLNACFSMYKKRKRQIQQTATENWKKIDAFCILHSGVIYFIIKRKLRHVMANEWDEQFLINFIVIFIKYYK